MEKINRKAIDTWKYLNNYTNREIAYEIGVTERTVSQKFNHGGRFKRPQEAKLRTMGFDLAWLGIGMQEIERDDNTART
jgi:hypothetical protein